MQPFIELEHHPQEQYEYCLTDENKHFQNIGTYLTKFGIISIPANSQRSTNLISNQDYITQKMHHKFITDLSVFKTFKASKLFKLWKHFTRHCIYMRNRIKLYENLIISHKVYRDSYTMQNELILQIEEINYLAIQEKGIYDFIGEKSLEKLQNRQNTKVGKILQNILDKVSEYVTTVDNEIKKHVDVLNAEVHENKMQSLTYKFLHAKEHYSKILSDETYKKVRHIEIKKIWYLHDQFYKLFLYKLTSALIHVILKNNRRFESCFFALKNSCVFEIELRLDLHKNLFILSPEKQELEDFVFNLLLKSRVEFLQNINLTKIMETIQVNYKTFKTQSNIDIERFIENMVQIIGKNEPENNVLNKLNNSYSSMSYSSKSFDEYLEVTKYYLNFMEEMEKEWIFQMPNVQKISYHLTKVDKYNFKLIKMHGFNSNFGDIIHLLTQKLKKQFQDFMKRIIENIRDSCLEHIEDDLRDFKYDLMYKLQSIEVLPKSIEEYIQQIKSIEIFIDNKQSFESKYNDYTHAVDMLRIHKIYINHNFTMLLEDINSILHKVPTSLEITICRIVDNSEEIDKSLNESFIQLIEKVKDFKRRYIKEYFKDPDKLDTPEKTLDELSKRTAGINEIGKLVNQYRQFDTQEYIDRIKKKGFFQKQKR